MSALVDFLLSECNTRNQNLLPSLLDASLQSMAELVCVEAFSESNNKRLLLKLDLACAAEWSRAWENFEDYEV